nr:uncharacterized protein LOC109189835 [Ipomoea trifida]
MKNKSEARKFIIKKFHAMVFTQFGVLIKTVRMDNGHEFNMHGFFEENDAATANDVAFYKTQFPFSDAATANMGTDTSQVDEPCFLLFPLIRPCSMTLMPVKLTRIHLTVPFNSLNSLSFFHNKGT